MSYGQYRNTGVRRLHTYAEAVAKFESTKPIRGRTDISKPMYPLGHRHRVDSFWMLKCPLTQDVEMYLYRTPVVTFKPNGNIKIKSDGWDTISSANFIGEVLGISAYIYDHNLCVAIHNEHGTQHFRVPSNESLTIRRENGRFVYVSGAPDNTVHTVNRKAANSVRSRYKEFKQYALAMIKLRDGQFSNEERDAVGLGGGYGNAPYVHINGHTWVYDKFAKTVSQMQQWMSATGEDKHNDYYKAFIVFAASFCMCGSTTREAFDAGFNYFTLGLHRDEVLTKEVLPLGVVKKDNYGKYWRRGWAKFWTEANNVS